MCAVDWRVSRLRCKQFQHRFCLQTPQDPMQSYCLPAFATDLLALRTKLFEILSLRNSERNVTARVSARVGCNLGGKHTFTGQKHTGYIHR